MKYVVFRDNCHNEELFVFPFQHEHAQFATWVVERLSGYWRTVRAGFVSLDAHGPACYGSSFSLGLKSDPQKDTNLLNTQLGRHDALEKAE